MADQPPEALHENEIRLSFKSTQDESHQVPLEYFTAALEAMQEAIYLLAMQEEGIVVRNREKTSAYLRAKFGIMCAPPASGSVVIDTYVGNPAYNLDASHEIASVIESFSEVAQAIKEQNQAALTKIVPDATRRSKVVQTFRRLAPKAGFPWTLDIAPAKHSSFHLNASDQAKVTALLKRSFDDEAVKTVTGSLARVDFDKRIVTLTYPVTNRDLECSYDESIEGLLLDNPRELIQVTGTVVMNDDGHPVRIKDVENIEELDLSPFEVGKFIYPAEGFELVLREPRVFEVKLDETKQILCIEDETLDLDAYAYTRDLLINEVIDQVLFLWREYASEDPEKLSPAAQKLRNALREQIDEVPLA